MATWRPTHLTPTQLEERRRAAARLLRAGHLAQADIARRLGVSRQSVSRWATTLRRDGLRGLRGRPRPGRTPRLSAAHWRQLTGVLHRGALAAGFETERWTLRRIAIAMERELGVRYHFRSLGRVLHARGWSPQRPVPRARERDEGLIAAWLRRDWPQIKRGLAARGASLPSWTRRVTRFGPP